MFLQTIVILHNYCSSVASESDPIVVCVQLLTKTLITASQEIICAKKLQMLLELCTNSRMKKEQIIV